MRVLLGPGNGLGRGRRRIDGGFLKVWGGENLPESRRCRHMYCVRDQNTQKSRRPIWSPRQSVLLALSSTPSAMSGWHISYNSQLTTATTAHGQKSPMPLGHPMDTESTHDNPTSPPILGRRIICYWPAPSSLSPSNRCSRSPQSRALKASVFSGLVEDIPINARRSDPSHYQADRPPSHPQKYACYPRILHNTMLRRISDPR
jgi:hypothetical protein